jgi:hypothetical protein
MDRLDDKVHGVLFRNKDNTYVPPDEYIVFRPQDNALPATLEFYRGECIRLGCAAPQMAALDQLIERVAAWRRAHPERLKLADVEPGECRDIPPELFEAPRKQVVPVVDQSRGETFPITRE